MAKLKQCLSCKKYTSDHDCGFYNLLDESDCKEYELPYNNSEGMFKHPFSFKGRIRRRDYILSYLLCWMICTPINLLSENDIEMLEQAVGLLLLIQVVTLWMLLAQGAKRCHDRGHSGFFQFVPFYIFWLFFAGEKEEVNKYGTSPRKSYEEQIYKSEEGNE